MQSNTKGHKVCPYVILSMTSMDTFDQPQQESWKAGKLCEGVKAGQDASPEVLTLSLGKFSHLEGRTVTQHLPLSILPSNGLGDCTTLFFGVQNLQTHGTFELPSALLESRLHLYAHLQASVPQDAVMTYVQTVCDSY